MNLQPIDPNLSLTQVNNTLAPLSPNQEKKFLHLEAYINGRLSSKHVASKLHSINVSALARPFRELTNLRLLDEDRIPAIVELFRRHHEQSLAKNADVLSFYPRSAPSDPESRIWALAETPQNFSVYLRNCLKIIVGGYKSVAFFEKIDFTGSTFHPFETFNLSKAVQIQPLKGNRLEQALRCIKNHAKMASYIRKANLSHVHIPAPPQLFFEDENLYFQKQYEVLDISLFQRKLDVHEILTIFSDVGNALTFLHSLEWTHNDVRLANILWERNNPPQRGVIGMLNDFDTLGSLWDLHCTDQAIEIIKERFDTPYLGLCGALDIICPLTDFYNFALMVHLTLSLLTEKQCKQIHNGILKNILTDKTPVDLSENEPQNSSDNPLTSLRVYFANAFEDLCDLTIRFSLDLLGNEFTADLKAEMKQIATSPGWDKLFPDALGKALAKLPKKTFPHEEVKAAFCNFKNPYTLQNMIDRIKQAMKELQSNL